MLILREIFDSFVAAMATKRLLFGQNLSKFSPAAAGGSASIPPMMLLGEIEISLVLILSQNPGLRQWLRPYSLTPYLIPFCMNFTASI
jgi:hypothetical protein